MGQCFLSKTENPASYFYEVWYLEFNKRPVFSQVTENFGEVSTFRTKLQENRYVKMN